MYGRKKCKARSDAAGNSGFACNELCYFIFRLTEKNQEIKQKKEKKKMRKNSDQEKREYLPKNEGWGGADDCPIGLSRFSAVEDLLLIRLHE